MGGPRGRRAWWADAALALLMVSGVGAAGLVGFEMTRTPTVPGASVSTALAASVETGPLTTLGPPAPAPTTTVAPVPPPPGACHPAYQGTCIPPNVRDADCYGMGQDGPWFVRDENVRVVGPDVFGLDPDLDGVACESQPGLHAGG